MVLVLEEYDAFFGNLSGCCIVAVRTQATVRTVRIHGGAIEEAQYAAHLFIQFLGGVFTFLDTFYIWYGKVVIIVGIAGTHGQSVRPCAELYVEPVLHGLVGIVCASPVAYHYAVIFPVALQNLVQSPLVMAVVFVLVEIVCTHDSPSLTFLYSSLEGWEIDFMEGTVAHDDVYLMTVFLLVIEAVMLYAG